MLFQITKIKLVFLFLFMVFLNYGVKSQSQLFVNANKNWCPKCPNVPIHLLIEDVVLPFFPSEESNMMADCYELDSTNNHARITFDFMLNKKNPSLQNFQPNSFALDIKATDLHNIPLPIVSVQDLLASSRPSGISCNQSGQWYDLIYYVTSDTAWRGRIEVLVDLNSNPYGGYINVEFQLGYKDSCQKPYTAFNNPVTVMSGMPCQDFYAHNVARTKIPTGTESIQNATLSPNPTNGHFSILLDSGPGEPVKVQIFDLHGRLTHDIRRKVLFLNNSYQLLIDEELEPGLYFLRISSGNFQQSLKLIRE